LIRCSVRILNSSASAWLTTFVASELRCLPLRGEAASVPRIRSRRSLCGVSERASKYLLFDGRCLAVHRARFFETPAGTLRALRGSLLSKIPRRCKPPEVACIATQCAAGSLQCRADLSWADLRGAFLFRTNLVEADLSWANMSWVENLTDESLPGHCRIPAVRWVLTSILCGRTGYKNRLYLTNSQLMRISRQ